MKRAALPALMLMACATPPPRPAPTVAALVALQQRVDAGGDLPRPGLGKGADTNDASAYFDYAALRVGLGASLDSAEFALLWASRLDPSWADPYFLRGMAIFQAYRKDALDVLWKTHSPRAAGDVAFPIDQLRKVDSLFHIAWGRNPFLYSGLDQPPQWGGRDDPSRAAAHYYFIKRFAAADSLFGMVLRKHPDAVAIRVYRARSLFYLGKFDSTVTELEIARDSLRHGAQGTLSYITPSTEMFDFAIGIARVQQDDFPAARAAFERALVSNLGFYWAHVRLAGSVLALHDTATALTELDQAVQLEGHDPVLRLFDGVVLHRAGRETAAAEQLERAEAIDPYFATPYYWLGETYRAEGRGPDAIHQYQQYLVHAARRDPDRRAVIGQLATLGITVPDSR